MKLQISIVLLAIVLGSACSDQEAQKKRMLLKCEEMIRVRGSDLNGPFKFLPTEVYKGLPVVKFQIEEDGTVSGALVGRSSGVADIDRKVLDSVARWRYKPRPIGCRVMDVEMGVVIDFGDAR